MDKMLRTMFTLSGALLLSTSCLAISADEKQASGDSSQAQSQAKGDEKKVADNDTTSKSDKDATKEAEKKESKAAKLEKQGESSIQEADKLKGEANQLKGLFSKPKPVPTK